MSFFVEDHDSQLRPQRQFKFFSVLFIIALSLSLILITIQISNRLYRLFTSPEKPLTSLVNSLQEKNSHLDLQNFGQFSSLFGNSSSTLSLVAEEKEINLNLDPSLLSASQSAINWELELNIDGNWEKISSFIGFNNLLTANPQLWRYLFVYQNSPQNLIAFDLRSLETITIFELELAQEWLTEINYQTASQLPFEKLEFAGISHDQVFVYLSNALDEGVLFSAPYRDDLNWLSFDRWQIWPNVQAKIARANDQTFFLNGYRDGCGEVYNFYRLPSLTNENGQENSSSNQTFFTSQLEKVATTYNGCFEGDRFLGVDSRGRLLISPVIANSQSSPDLDLTGTYQDVYAIPLDEPQNKVRLLGTQELPSNLNRIAFFPDIGEAGYSLFELDATDSPDASTSASRISENLILTNENSVWRYNFATDQLDTIGRLDRLFGQVLPRSWRGEELCLEIIDRPELSLTDRLVTLDTKTGVALTGLVGCQTQTPDLGPAVGGSLTNDYQIQKRLTTIELPADFRLVPNSNSLTD